MPRDPQSLVYQFGTVEYDLSSRTHVMGILNVTPDSFSDGGAFLEPQQAIDRGLRMVEEGADFIDIGGESTRPRGKSYGEGAKPVDADEELRRVLPVIRGLASQTDVPISIDTYKSAVARRALAEGAVIVNDISGFHFDEEMPSVVAEAGASAVLMHIRGTPETMQQDPTYDDVLKEVTAYLRESIGRGEAAGIRQMFVDPGIGFGKLLAHNLELLRELGKLRELGYPVLVGPSRKSFIGAILDLPVRERLEGSLAAVAVAAVNGASVVRVHDVQASRRVALVASAIRSGKKAG